ncbi:MAG: hypothetical protein J4G18_10480 [Anaerolineae bacterium]|nr:hypothetical protein [Anaerolineae bacterium]
MSAKKLRIRSRHRQHPGVIASLADFEWQASETVDMARLMDDPRLTLYCLDAATEQAIFTATPAGIDLSRSPFMYQTQFDSAEYLVALPLFDFAGIADSIEPPGESILFLHNIGRCGSTLLCRALNEAPGVVAFSEPDALTGLLSLRHWSRSSVNDFFRASLVWLFRPAVVSGTHFVVKLRNQAAGMLKPFIDAMPEATHLFMYRDAIDWLASFHRLRVKRGDTPTRYSRATVIEQQAAYYQCSLADIAKLAPSAIRSYLGLEGRALAWLYMLERYLDCHDTGWPISALRYEDLQSNPDEVLKSVLAMMGLPDADGSAAQRVFQSDAQAGTRFARDGQRGNTVALPAEMQATVSRLLALQPVINSADYTLPDTLRLE